MGYDHLRGTKSKGRSDKMRRFGDIRVNARRRSRLSKFEDWRKRDER